MRKEALRTWYPHSERILMFEQGTYGSREAYRRSPFGEYLLECRNQTGLSMIELTVAAAPTAESIAAALSQTGKPDGTFQAVNSTTNSLRRWKELGGLRRCFRTRTSSDDRGCEQRHGVHRRVGLHERAAVRGEASCRETARHAHAHDCRFNVSGRHWSRLLRRVWLHWCSSRQAWLPGRSAWKSTRSGSDAPLKSLPPHDSTPSMFGHLVDLTDVGKN